MAEHKSKLYKKIESLTWNVYKENFGSNITIFNIFNNSNLIEKIEKLILNYKKELKQVITSNEKNINNWIKKYKNDNFKNELERFIKYEYWGRCEYEVIITDFPTSIEREEFERITKEYTKDYKYRMCINLSNGIKVDIYQQVMLNFNVFVNYVWNSVVPEVKI